MYVFSKHDFVPAHDFGGNKKYIHEQPNGEKSVNIKLVSKENEMSISKENNDSGVFMRGLTIDGGSSPATDKAKMTSLLDSDKSKIQISESERMGLVECVQAINLVLADNIGIKITEKISRYLWSN